MGLLAASGKIIANASYGVLANYVYDYLRRKQRLSNGVNAFFPLPAETHEKIDHHLKKYIEIWFSKYVDHTTPSDDLLYRLLRQIKDDKKRIYLHSLLEAIFFEPELASKRISDDLKLMAEKDEVHGGYIKGKPIDVLAEEMVSGARDYFSQNLPEVERLVGLIKNVEKSVELLDTIQSAKKQDQNLEADNDQVFLSYMQEKYREVMISGFDAFVKTDKFTNDINKSFVSLRVQNRNKKNAFITAEEIVDNEQYVILRGNPGCGKTTLMQWLAVNHTRSKSSSSYLPVLVPLRKMVADFGGKFSIESCGEVACDDPDVKAKIGSSWLANKLARGQVLLMLDGLDEVPFEHRGALWRFTAKIMDEFPSTKIVVTSRNLYLTHNSSGDYKDPFAMSVRDFSASQHEWSPPTGFLDFQIHGLRRQDISVFIDRWHSGIDLNKIHDGVTRDLDTTASALKTALFSGNSSENLLQLCVNPMLCALLCLVNLVEKGELPNTPKTLYRHALNILLMSRDEIRGIVTEPKFLPIDKVLRQRLLEYVAFLMQETFQNTKNAEYLAEVEKSEVLEWIQHYAENDEEEAFGALDAEDVLWFLVERISVLREPTTNRIDFVHRSFMEYLAGEHFARTKPTAMIAHYAKRDQWHGTLKFMVNSEFGREATNSAILKELLKLASDDNGLSTYRNFILDMLEYIENYHVDELDTYSQTVAKLRPIEPREAHKLRKAKFAVLSEHFGTEPKSKELFEEAAYVYLHHRSSRSLKILKAHFSNYADEKFCLTLNLRRDLPLKEQKGLVSFLRNNLSGGATERQRVESLYCDDIQVFNRISRFVLEPSKSKFFLKVLVIDSNTINLGAIAELFGVVKIKIDSGFLNVVQSIAVSVREAGYDGTIVVNESLRLEDLTDYGSVAYL